MIAINTCTFGCHLSVAGIVLDAGGRAVVDPGTTPTAQNNVARS